jgi:hypothetical protein
MERIVQEGYNLNISRHVGTAVAEEEIDLAANHQALVEIEKRIAEATNKHNGFIEKLGLPPIPLAKAGIDWPSDETGRRVLSELCTTPALQSIESRLGLQCPAGAGVAGGGAGTGARGRQVPPRRSRRVTKSAP